MRLFVFVFILIVSGLDATAQSTRGFWPFLNQGAERILVQPDGKVLVSGAFSQVSGTNFANFGRLTSVGDPDTSFRPLQAARAETDGLRPNVGYCTSSSDCVVFALQHDGKIIVVRNTGNSYTYRFSRLNVDGSTDLTFIPPIFSHPGGNQVDINAIALAPDGKIYVGGDFHTVGGIVRNNLVRLNQDGSLDLAFGPVYPFSNGTLNVIFDVLVLADGRLIVAGAFDALGGAWRTGIARLNQNGTADTTFVDHGVPPPRYVSRIYRQSDGRLLVNGSLNGGPSGLSDSSLVRLNANGSLDNSFVPPIGKFACVEEISTDLKLLCIDRYNYVSNQERPIVIRLNGSNGSLDPTYNSPLSRDITSAIAIQPDGKLLVGGFFTLTQTPKLRFLIRLNADGSLDEPKITQFDYDGDQKADISVFRPSNGKWYILGSSVGFWTMNWGTLGDTVVAADYDGDGITDMAVFRPSNSTWFIINSVSNTSMVIQYGATGDLPSPGLVDRDRKADVTLFRPSTGKWYVRSSTDLQQRVISYGQTGDIPIAGSDFDGDLLSDLSVYRPSDRQWKTLLSSLFPYNFNQVREWGVPTDKMVPADYDGDGLTDYAVFRPSTGEWWILPSFTPNTISRSNWGVPDDIPVPADYDGDATADRAVFRPSNNTWYIIGSSTGIRIVQFGAAGDIPTPANLR